MKISFLVTYYNQAQYVKDSLDSILAINKNYDWEILVGDDGSTDETVSIVNEYIKKYPDNIKLFIQNREENKNAKSIQRASFNRLNLIEHCSGDYFCIIDGDDFYCSDDFIEQAVSIFNKDEKLSVVAFNFQKLYSNGETEKSKTIDVQSNTVISYSDYLRKCYIHAGACVFKNTFKSDKSSIEKLKKIGSFDDSDIIVNAFNYGRMFFFDKVIYNYRQTDEGLWTDINEIEQNILNLVSFDLEAAIAPSLEKDLFFRSFVAIYKVWHIRKSLTEKISETNLLKYDIMLEGINKFKTLSFNILHYKNISLYTKASIKAKIYLFILRHPKFFLLNLRDVLLKR